MFSRIKALLVSLILAEIHKHYLPSPFKVDLRSSKIDILLTCTRIYAEQDGSSAGVVWALGLLQLMTECAFIGHVSGDRHLSMT